MVNNMELYYSKLTPLVELIENNEYCVLLKVKPLAQTALIKLPGFTGTELMFRLTKVTNRKKPTVDGMHSSIDVVGYAELTTWSSGGKCETDDRVAEAPANYKEAEILKCICVDYAIPVFISQSETFDIPPCLDFRTVYDKYRSPNTLLEFRYRDSGECSVYLNGYSIYTGLLDTPAGAREVYERLPLLKQSSAYAYWYGSYIADKLRARGTSAWRDIVNTTDSVKLVDVVDPQAVADYVDLCYTDPYSAQIYVGGVFSIGITKEPADARYNVSITRPDIDLGEVTIGGPITIPFQDLRCGCTKSELESITVKPIEMKDAEHRDIRNSSSGIECRADARKD